MRVNNILKIESECKIIRPRFIKNQINKIDDFEIQYTKKTSHRNAIDTNYSFNEDDIKDLSQIIRSIKKSKSLNFENEEKDENAEDFLINSDKIKKKNSIIELLNILSQPIISEYSKSRNFLNNYKSTLYRTDENNKQNEEIINIENENKINEDIRPNNNELEAVKDF